MNKTTIAALAIAALACGARAQKASALDNPRFLDLKEIPGLEVSADKALDANEELLELPAPKAVGAAAAAAKAKAKPVLGKPVREFFVRLDALKAWKAGDDVEALLVDTKLVHYPVLSNGEAEGNIIMANDKEGWKMISIGEKERSKLRKRAIGNSMKRFAKAEEEHFLVRIPSMSLEFTAFRNASGALQLTSIADSEKAGLTAGEAEDAVRVIARLVPLAKAQKELKPDVK